ncbi:MAG: MBL fold metallo-hydrolase, partial [Butyrivibrio sp.]|nr:MBL fold metallo-hydrolase [Butyrivibrio sp.]
MGEAAKLLYQGHASVRITTPEGKTIYVDPYAGEGYDVPADLILETHGHFDHTQT